MKRKIAAIFAADIAGYSRLVAEDEEETLRRLASYRSVTDDFIAKAGGRIFNTAGDAVLAEFPSAVEAVRCAIDIQESLRTRNMAYPPSRQMSFRIGITIGDVVERDGDLLGDGVNIAARLEALAEVGGICVSRAVHEQVVNKLSVQFADIGAQEVKNIPTPVHAFMVAMRREDGTYTTPLAKKKPAIATTQPIWTWPALIAAVAIGAVTFIYSSAIKRAILPEQLSSASTPAVSTQVALAPAVLKPSSSLSPTLEKPSVRPLEGSSPSINGPDTQRFDGIWTAIVVCVSTPELPGWKSTFVGRVRDGVFHGQIGEEGKPGSETYDGMIAPDGSADISHIGYSGDSKKDPFHRPTGTAFWNTYLSKFDGSHGSGTRNDRGTCNVDFTKSLLTSPTFAKPDVTALNQEASPPSVSKPALAENGSSIHHTLFTAADGKNVTDIAKQKGFDIPAFEIASVENKVPVEFRRFVGVWASKVGYGNGVGRQAMLIVTDVSVEGDVSGYDLWGPPTKDSFYQTPADYKRFQAKISNGRFDFRNGDAITTITLLATNVVRIRDDHKDGKTATVFLEPVWMVEGK